MDNKDLNDKIDEVARRVDSHINACRLFQFILTMAAIYIAWKLNGR